MIERKLNWLVTLVLSILFGYFGVDRFMMGQIGCGILKFLTFGGLGVWYLADIILIATKYHFQGVEWTYFSETHNF
jgi:TM2 domain-containing membrane protein YozV